MQVAASMVRGYLRNVSSSHQVPDGCVDSQATGNAHHDIQGLVLDLQQQGQGREAG